MAVQSGRTSSVDTHPEDLGRASDRLWTAGRIQSVATPKGLLARSVLLPAALALTVMLVAGCGGGGHRAKVEDTLQDSLNTLDPALRTAFPVGAGPPRVKENSCRKIQERQVLPPRPPGRPILPAQLPRRLVRPAPRPPQHLAFWSCVVRFAHTPFHLRVALEDNGKIYAAMLMPRQVLRPGTATVYQGGPKQPKP
jgi:hypothetical protein